ncbi:hypothetical protein [Chitinilyticum litopenaei]|uniref:hypothetical protein n=1 Tax=Chitinilyticum litopenaei TaxID=1121276 RepID=UPI00048BF61D|nr:hypothetical protein [Chitinilyticum litopenaei]
MAGPAERKRNSRQRRHDAAQAAKAAGAHNVWVPVQMNTEVDESTRAAFRDTALRHGLTVGKLLDFIAQTQSLDAFARQAQAE